MGNGHRASGFSHESLFPFPLSPLQVPMPHAPCPMPIALFPIPYSLFPILHLLCSWKNLGIGIRGLLLSDTNHP